MFTWNTLKYFIITKISGENNFYVNQFCDFMSRGFDRLNVNDFDEESLLI